MNNSIFIYEFKHFYRSKAKFYSYITFMLLCIYSLINGYSIQEKQQKTINEIYKKQEKEIAKVIDWYDSDQSGPSDNSRVDINDPFWAILYNPTYVVKNSSQLYPLGIGQSEQFSFYKETKRWSSTYDPDMAEEISNYERLINGSIDFSFLIIFLLPILYIIFTYNINSLEKDLNFHKLVSIQSLSLNKWIISRLLFYLILILISVDSLIIIVGLINGGVDNINQILKLILLSNIYISIFSLIFYFINLKSKKSSTTSFKMINIWMIFCVIIPGSVHQYANYKYPANFMTSFLDTNRKEKYEVFKLEDDDLHDLLIELYPNLDNLNNFEDQDKKQQNIRRSISAIINQMNIHAANEIEKHNEFKNELIKSSYIYNPISYVQNLWNCYTETDYYSYKDYRFQIQASISKRNELMLSEIWHNKKSNKQTYLKYIKQLKTD